MKQIPILLIVLLSITSSAWAQKHSDQNQPLGDDETLMLKGKTHLVVLLQSPDDDVVKKLTAKNTAGLNSYNKLIEDHNEILKASVVNAWEDDLHIEFKTLEELKELSETVNKENYLVLYTLYMTQSKAADGSITLFFYYTCPFSAKDFDTPMEITEFFNDNWYKYTYEPLDVYRLPSLRYDTDYYLSITTLDEFILNPHKTKKSLTQAILSFEMNNFYEPREFYDYSLQFLNYRYKQTVNHPEKIKEEFYSENASQLSKMKLLIPEQYIANDAELSDDKTGNKLKEWTLNHEELETMYPYEYEIVSAAEINRAIQEKTPGLAYLILSPIRSETSIVVMDAETGNMLLVTRPFDPDNNYNAPHILIDQMNTMLFYINK